MKGFERLSQRGAPVSMIVAPDGRPARLQPARIAASSAARDLQGGAKLPGLATTADMKRQVLGYP